MKQLILFLLALTILSCETTNKNTGATMSNNDDTLDTDSSVDTLSSNAIKKIPIDYKINKDLLEIILLLPDSAFSSWEWKIDDRKKWYNEIKANNYYLDNTPDYFDVTYFEPRRARFTIVDGSWSINIYKSSDHAYLVITDDIVGDGHSLHYYEVKSSILTEYSSDNMPFSNFTVQLKRNDNIENCKEVFNELNDPIFVYDFKSNDKVEIESSWYLPQASYSNCLKGNAIIYNFNAETKKFDIEKIYWKPKLKD